jgi:hypothetical protein
VPLEHLGAGRHGLVAQDRLESGLADEQPAARGQLVVDADVEAGDDVGELATGEAVHRHDRALGEELLLRLDLDGLLDPGGPEQLDRADVEVGRPGERRSTPQALDDE